MREHSVRSVDTRRCCVSVGLGSREPRGLDLSPESSARHTPILSVGVAGMCVIVVACQSCRPAKPSPLPLLQGGYFLNKQGENRCCMCAWLVVVVAIIAGLRKKKRCSWARQRAERSNLSCAFFFFCLSFVADHPGASAAVVDVCADLDHAAAAGVVGRGHLGRLCAPHAADDLDVDDGVRHAVHAEALGAG